HLYLENHIKLINALKEKLKVIYSPVQEGVLPLSNIPLETHVELLRAQAIYKNPIGLAIKSKVEYEDKYAKINQLNQIFDEISSGKDTYRSF
nr:hypothetical protein [Parachlamydiaceae bacterium]